MESILVYKKNTPIGNWNENHYFYKKKGMTAIELKQFLFHRIAEINDESFLNALKTIIETKSQSQKISLLSQQRNEIIESKNDIENGLFCNETQLDIEFKKWANE